MAKEEKEIHNDEFNKGFANAFDKALSLFSREGGGKDSCKDAVDHQEVKEKWCDEVETHEVEQEKDESEELNNMEMPMDELKERVVLGTVGTSDDNIERIYLKSFDIAGQVKYGHLQHLFITGTGVYLLVTRLDMWRDWLEDKTPQQRPRLCRQNTDEDDTAYRPRDERRVRRVSEG